MRSHVNSSKCLVEFTYEVVWSWIFVSCDKSKCYVKIIVEQEMTVMKSNLISRFEKFLTRTLISLVIAVI